MDSYIETNKAPTPSEVIIRNCKREVEKIKSQWYKIERYKEFRKAGLEPKDAATKAGFSALIVSQAISRLEPFFNFSYELVAVGINNKTLADKLKEQLNAESIIATKSGIIKDADWVARDKALDKALKYLVPEKKAEVEDRSNVQITINIPTANVPIDITATREALSGG